MIWRCAFALSCEHFMLFCGLRFSHVRNGLHGLAFWRIRWLGVGQLVEPCLVVAFLAAFEHCVL